MIEAVLETLRKNRLRDAYIRLLVTRGVGDLGLNPTICKTPSVIVITEPASPSTDPRSKAAGITAIISSIRRDPVDATSHEVKSLNYLNSILARWEAIEAGVNEAIMLDTQGFVSEATAENVFIVRKGKIATPSTNSAILHGVTRQKIIEISENLGYAISEREITPFELINSEEVFLTGTLAEIVPVLKVNGRVIGSGRVGPVTARIFGEFAKIRGEPGEGIPILSGEGPQGQENRRLVSSGILSKRQSDHIEITMFGYCRKKASNVSDPCGQKSGRGSRDSFGIASALRVTPVKRCEAKRNYFARTHESAPQRMHFTPSPIGFEGSFARIEKYLSVSVDRGSMCLQLVHSAKWKRFGGGALASFVSGGVADIDALSDPLVERSVMCPHI